MSRKINKVKLQNELTYIKETSISGITAEEDFLNDKVGRALHLEDLRTRKEFNDLLKQNREERKKYARYIFILTCIWASLIFLIILAVGLRSVQGKPWFSFVISDTVLVTLISSTTINFFGFFLLVVKYLFHTGQETSGANSTEKNEKKVDQAA